MTPLAWFTDSNLLGRWFASPTWEAARTLVAAIFAGPMTPAQHALYQQCTGRTELPTQAFREAWIAAGRGAGKTIIASAIAVIIAASRDWRTVLGPGELATVMLLASDRKQARVAMRYIRAMLRETPMLAQLIESETRESVTLSTHATIEIHTCSFTSVRGYGLAAVIADEVAFWRYETDSASPDVETIRALRPGLARVPDSLLLGLSSPYSKRGVLWEQHKKYHGVEDAPVLTWQAPSRLMNPSIPQDVVDRALEEDPIGARAEWLGVFRDDVEEFLPRDVVLACVVAHRQQVPPAADITYRVTFDAAGGSGTDSLAMAIYHCEHTAVPDEAIHEDNAEWHERQWQALDPQPVRAHRASNTRIVIDYLYERKPPFNPVEVIKECADLAKVYGVRHVVGDRFGGEWVRQPLRDHGLVYDIADRASTDFYRDALAVFTSRRIELPENNRLIAQLCGLERRTSRGGRDSISHHPGAHDDVALVVCMAAALGAERIPRFTRPIRLVGL